jgi:osmotically inducible protein OsmC
MAQLEKLLYTAKTRTSGGRDGASRSCDGRLDVMLSSPGSPGGGTNPEQLLAAEVDLGTARGAYGLAARLNVSLPGMERTVARRLVEAAHQVCPYSRATRGNIEVAINLI